MSRVVISNGFNRFQLAVAAAEAHKRGMLGLFLTGAYPTPMARIFISAAGLVRQHRFARLLDRGEEIPDHLVHSFFFAEGIHHANKFLPNVAAFRKLRAALDVLSLRVYGWFAFRLIKHKANIKVYHYRAGFGGSSVAYAKSIGITALCEHSIAHPSVLEYLVQNEGLLPLKGVVAEMSDFWHYVLRDIEQADAVLVNSEFVKETFLHQGWKPEDVHAIYRGVDDRFLDTIPPRRPEALPDPAEPLRLLFAGSLEQRKGAEELLGALTILEQAFPWSLEIAGSIDPAVALRFHYVLNDPRVRHLGTLSRTSLAARMAAAEIFVFCSRAEGSARVIFEALAAGCYVITTPNSGSIVEDGVHGAVVPPGDSGAVVAALRGAFSDRNHVREVGNRNAELIRDRYRQEHYGDALEKLYGQLSTRQGAV